MTSKRVIFLTGATGLLGSRLLKILLESGNIVYCLAKDKKGKPAQQRLKERLSFWDKKAFLNYKKNLVIIEGDITQENLAISDKKNIQRIINQAEIIIHAAAVPNLSLPLETAYKLHVEGTKNVLDFALNCKKLEKFNYISTLHIAGTKVDFPFSEDRLDIGQKFNNSYEMTKYQAEKLVVRYLKKGLDISIFRPSIIIGDSLTGETVKFQHIYKPIRFFSLGIYEKFPADLSSTVNLINVDQAARAIYLLSQRKNFGVYHICSPNNLDIKCILDSAADYFNFKLPEFIKKEKFDFSSWTATQKELASPFIPYFNQKTNFVSEKTKQILNQEYGFSFPKINRKSLFTIFSYCHRVGYIVKK